MTFEELNVAILALQTANPGVQLTHLPRYSELMTQYTNAQTQAAVSTAVKSEKDKLYKTIDTYKADLVTANGDKARLSAQVNDYNTKFQNISQQFAPQPNNPAQPEPMAPITSQNFTPQNPTMADVDRLNKAQMAGISPQQFQEMMDKKFNETLPNMIQEAVKPLMEAQQNLSQQTVESYKETRLKELGDTVIPEMITGSSKEEIEQSIQNSVAVRTRYNTQNAPQQVPPTHTPQVAQQQYVAPTPTPAPQIPQPNAVPPAQTPITQTPPQASLVDNVKAMSSDDYAKHRAQMMSELGSQYGGNQ
jgi:hypothetical protein